MQKTRQWAVLGVDFGMLNSILPFIIQNMMIQWERHENRAASNADLQPKKMAWMLCRVEMFSKLLRRREKWWKWRISNSTVKDSADDSKYFAKPCEASMC